MRIASKAFLSIRARIFVGAGFLMILGGGPALSLTRAYAADALPLPPPVAAAPEAAAGLPSAVSTKAPDEEGIDKKIAPLEKQVSEDAKTMVKQLNTESGPFVLKDLNNARQTVARIEAMIDIEKHMVELDKLRGERGGHKGPTAALAGAIPASALMPPPVLASSLRSQAKPAEPVRQSSAGMEISRIVGTDGRYVAILKLVGGSTKAVKVGDRIFNNARVRSISLSSVEIEENGESRVLHIKNADEVYSALR